MLRSAPSKPLSLVLPQAGGTAGSRGLLVTRATRRQRLGTARHWTNPTAFLRSFLQWPVVGKRCSEDAVVPSCAEFCVVRFLCTGLDPKFAGTGRMGFCIISPSLDQPEVMFGQCTGWRLDGSHGAYCVGS